ncbi:MAG: hypothetical protein HGB14_05220, partial [Anaerolineaceae bacterium]|nr:hypothetical protein [Anaerolineaceae bacterium]
DQFVRALSMFREAVKAFPPAEWCKGDTPYQRPAGLALHTVEAVDDYAVLKQLLQELKRPIWICNCYEP